MGFKQFPDSQVLSYVLLVVKTCCVCKAQPTKNCCRAVKHSGLSGDPMRHTEQVTSTQFPHVYNGESNLFLQWIILWANLTGQRDAQVAGKTLFLDVSVKVETWGLSKENPLTILSGYHSLH